MKILAYRLPELEAKINKFNKKATKWGLPLVTYSVTGSGVEERKIPDPDNTDEPNAFQTIRVEYVLVEIVGEVPRIAGWSIHSKIQPSDIAGQNYVFTNPHHEAVEGLRTRPLFCEHCNTKRLKKTGYLIQHEDGRQMMVGATCLQDFLPSIDIENLIAYMNSFGDLGCDEDEDWAAMRIARVYYTEDAIMDAYLSIKKYGFVSKALAEETGKNATAWDIDPSPKRQRELYKDVDIDATRKELEGFKPHIMAKSTFNNDFIHNAQLALQSEIVRPRLYAFIAAALNVWIKDMEHARADAASDKKVSNWVGSVGERLTINNMKIVRLNMNEGEYGWTYIYGFVDEQGNQYTWFGSKNIGEVDKIVSLRGTVKNHGEYRGKKQTILTRCTLV